MQPNGLMVSRWPWAEIWTKLGEYSSQEKGDSCVCCLWDYNFNIACAINCAVIKLDLCHNLLYCPLLKTCSWAVRERWIAQVQNQLTMKTCTYLFPYRRISKLNIFFPLIFEDIQLCHLSLFQLLWDALTHHLCHGLASLLVCFHWHSPLCVFRRSVHPDPGKCRRRCLLLLSREELL